MSEPPTFNWDSIRPGEKTAQALDVVTTDQTISLPILAARGAFPGKTLVVSAGVHGDEYEGIQAIFDIFAQLDPAEMHGAFLAVTVANPPAFWNATRTSPIDNGNLARVFPGNPNGTTTEAIAYYFDQHILSKADLYLDLHSAGVKWLMPTLIGYHETDTDAAPAAEAFGAPVIWLHPTMATGRTVSAAAARRIPSLYAEAGGGGRIHPDDLAVYTRGIRNLLRYLRILPGDVESCPTPIRLYGDGNIDSSIASKQQGFLTPLVELLQPVSKGQRLGILQDLWGRGIETIHAPRQGVVVLIHACRMVLPDEPLFLITSLIE